MFQTIAIAAGAAVAGGVLVLALLSLTARRPSDLGASGGRLARCPARPNCVCTHDDDPRHRAAPLTYTGGADEAMARLLAALSSRPRARVVAQTPTYLHAEFTSLVFHFVDDVEFLLDDGAKVIHFRSASRAGYGDFGANRRRMEDLRRRFDSAGRTSPPPD